MGGLVLGTSGAGWFQFPSVDGLVKPSGLRKNMISDSQKQFLCGDINRLSKFVLKIVIAKNNSQPS